MPRIFDSADRSADADGNLPALRCLHCGYDLTGLPTNRCPECGHEFDAEYLSRVARGEPEPATPWDTQRDVSGFGETFVLVLAVPSELARDFPPIHDARAATAYSLVCYALAGLILMVGPLGVLPRFSGLMVVVPIVWMTWGFLCEMLVAGLLTALVRPTLAPRPYHFWRGLLSYGSGFTVFSAIWYALFWWITRANPDAPVYVLMAVAAVGLLSWWVATIGLMVRARTPSGPGRLLAYAVAPLAGLVAVLGGVVTAVAILAVFH